MLNPSSFHPKLLENTSLDVQHKDKRIIKYKKKKKNKTDQSKKEKLGVESTLTAGAATIKLADDSTKDNLEHAVARENTVVGIPGRSINHVADALCSQVVVEFAERFFRRPGVPDLEELDADLVQRRLELVELAGVLHDDALRVVCGTAVGDDDDVDRLDVIHVRGLAELGGVRLEDVVQTRSRFRRAAWLHGPEDVVHDPRIIDLVVAAISLALAAAHSSSVVEEVQVNAVAVAVRAYGRDAVQDAADLLPAAPVHGAGVVDDEDSVEGA